MANTEPFSQPLRVAHLNPRQPTTATAAPDASARRAIADALGLTDLPRARLEAQIAPTGAQAWALTGRLTATVVQPCVVTLAPVTTKITEDVRRIYSPHAHTPEGDEVEMRDDEVEPLGQVIDLGAVLTEALALALPEYPRAEGAALDPGVTGDDSDTDTRRPFAGLGDLLGRRPEG